jgi:iron complex outermembrane receptor protein
LKFKPYIIAALVSLSAVAHAEEPFQIEVTGTCRDITPIPAGCLIELPPVIVEATRGNPYSDQQSPVTAGTRIPTKPIDTPRMVQAIDAQAIADQGDVNVAQAVMRNAPGIGLNANLAGNRSNIMLRGVNIQDNYGSRIDGQLNLTWADVDLYNVEQIQVVQGPNASFAGMSDPGGYVNYVTKKADWSNTFETYQTVTTNGGYIGSIQQNYAISDALAGRTVITYGDGSNPALNGNTDKQRIFFSQNFELKVSPDTLVEFDYRHSQDNQNYANTSLLPAMGSAPAPISLKTNMASPNDQFNVKEDAVDVRVNHRINDDLTWVAMAKYQQDDRMQQYLSPSQLSNAGILKTSYGWSDTIKSYSTYDTYLSLEKHVFGLKNNLVVGTDYAYSNTDGTSKSSSANYYINIYNPTFSNFNWQYGPTTWSNAQQQTYGVYMQDQLFLTDKLILTGGLRYDTSTQWGSTTAANGAVTPLSDATISKTNPNVGVVYKINSTTSVYADYSTGFMPQSQSNAGPPVASSIYAPPLESSQKEVGFKYIDPAGYSFTTAVYDLVMNNFQTPDPTNPVLSVYTGQVENKGVEMQGTAKLTKNLTGILNYAYTHSEVTQDNPTSSGTSNLGNQLPSVAHNMANAWVMWDDFHDGHAWGIGTGVTYVGKRAGDIQNDFWLPSYTVLNATAYYEPVKNTRIQLTLNNITNEQYYAAANSRYAILQGTPFVGMLTINFKY